MSPVSVVILSKVYEFSFKVLSVPEKEVVKIFTTNGTNDAPGELVQDDEHPVALQENGFTPKQVNAPEAVLGVPEKG